MRITRNYDGVPEQTGFSLIPENEILMFEISEREDGYSAAGDVMIKIILNCIEEGPYEGNKIWDNILLPSRDSRGFKIAGRSKRFLHAIGEPYQGTSIDIDTERWDNKTVEVKVGTDVIVGGKNDGKLKNVVKQYMLLEEERPSSSKKSNAPAPDFPF